MKIPNLYSQNDVQWKNDKLGVSGTIGSIGCLMVDAAMLLCWFGIKVTPKTLNQKITENNGYSGNLFIWQIITAMFPEIKWGILVGGLHDPLTKTQMDFIRAKIDEGFPVVLQIDTIPATSKLDEHWVLAVDYDGDDFIVADPWDGVLKRITSWGKPPQEIIYAYAYYKGKPTIQANPTITISVVERDWLIGAATVRKEVATYLEIVNPDTASFEAIQRVVAGIKSSVTDFQTKWQTELAERKNREEQVSRLKEQLTNEIKLRTELSKALGEAIEKISTTTKVYEDRLVVIQGQIDTLGKEKGGLNTQLLACKTANLIENMTIGDVLVLLFNKLKTIKLK